MANLNKKIKKELVKRFTESGFEPVTITMKSDGTVLTLDPCGYDVASEEDIEFVLVRGTAFAHYFDGTLDEASEKLAKYDIVKAEFKQDELDLRSFAASCKGISFDSDQFQLFSDWHKEIYCCRPKNWEILGNPALEA